MFWLLFFVSIALVLVLASFWRVALAIVRIWFLELAILILTWSLFRRREWR